MAKDIGNKIYLNHKKEIIRKLDRLLVTCDRMRLLGIEIPKLKNSDLYRIYLNESETEAVILKLIRLYKYKKLIPNPIHSKTFSIYREFISTMTDHLGKELIEVSFSNKNLKKLVNKYMAAYLLLKMSNHIYFMFLENMDLYFTLENRYFKFKYNGNK